MSAIVFIDDMLKLLSLPDGWCQGTYTNGKGYCLIGAWEVLNNKGKMGRTVLDRMYSVATVLDRMYSVASAAGFPSIAAMNDSPGFTQAKALQFLLKVRETFTKEQNNAV